MCRPAAEGLVPDTMIPASDEGPDKTNALQPATPGQLDLGPGQWMIARGSRTEFFAIGALARALNRKPVTLRKLEAAGQLPKSDWQDARVRGKDKRRLYARAQIEAAVRIAGEEGILPGGPSPGPGSATGSSRPGKNLEIDGAGTLSWPVRILPTAFVAASSLVPGLWRGWSEPINAVRDLRTTASVEPRGARTSLKTTLTEPARPRRWQRFGMMEREWPGVSNSPLAITSTR
jgi:hypothetical protein